jgi:hypothetical protein
LCACDRAQDETSGREGDTCAKWSYNQLPGQRIWRLISNRNGMKNTHDDRQTDVRLNLSIPCEHTMLTSCKFPRKQHPVAIALIRFSVDARQPGSPTRVACRGHMRDALILPNSTGNILSDIDDDDN